MIQILSILAGVLLGIETPLIHIETAEAKSVSPILTIEERITQELGPEFVEIARCESELEHFRPDGSVKISPTSDKGLFQVNWVHWEEAEALGLDLDTIEGNIAFAKILKSRNGTGDWYMSQHCWQK